MTPHQRAMLVKVSCAGGAGLTHRGGRSGGHGGALLEQLRDMGYVVMRPGRRWVVTEVGFAAASDLLKKSKLDRHA
jgi:hypothetical protein